MIKEIIPGNTTRMRILKAIYENPGINITEIIKKTKTSPNIVIKYVNGLGRYKVITENNRKKNKKAHVRNISANYKPELAKILFSLVEEDKKYLFFEKYKSLYSYITQMEEILNDKEITIIYGSYARSSAEKDSDIDLLIIGLPTPEKIRKIKEIFVTFDKEVSLKYETEKQFMKNLQKPLYQNILKEHVISIGAVNYLRLLEKLGVKFN